MIQFDVNNFSLSLSFSFSFYLQRAIENYLFAKRILHMSESIRKCPYVYNAGLLSLKVKWL